MTTPLKIKVMIDGKWYRLPNGFKGLYKEDGDYLDVDGVQFPRSCSVYRDCKPLKSLDLASFPENTKFYDLSIREEQN